MKNDLNSVVLGGNLVSDPRLAYEANGRPVTMMRISSLRCFKTEDKCSQEVCLFDIAVYNKQAEVCAAQMSKGHGVRVIGRLRQQTWQEEDGSDRERIIVCAEHVEFTRKREERP